MITKFKFYYIGSLLLLPFLTLAQAVDRAQISSVTTGLVSLINLTLRLLLGIAILVFIWGMIRFIAKADDAEARKQGKQYMVWGLVALVVMTSLIGIIQLVANLFLGSRTNGLVEQALLY